MAAPLLVESAGVRLTVRHYYDFGADRPLVGGDLASADSWDALRTGSEGAFAMPATRAELEREADANAELRERGRAIARWLDARGVRTLASYGVGVGVLELWLLRLAPSLELRLTDFAPATVARLGGLFPEASVVQHDLRQGLPLEAAAHLLHRVDTELTDDEWLGLLSRFAGERVLVVATEIAGVRRIAAELVQRARRRHLTRAGWLRTRSAFEALWRPTHEATALRLHDLDAWALEPRRQKRP